MNSDSITALPGWQGLDRRLRRAAGGARYIHKVHSGSSEEGRAAIIARLPGGGFRGLPREVGGLTAAAFTVALGYGIAAPAIPQFARQFGVSTAAAASVISVFALVRVAGALPAGRLVNRFGERAVMVTGIAVVAVSSVLAGFSGSFAQLIVLRGAGGLGSAMYTVGAQTLLLATVPAGQRGRATGLFSGGFLVGAIVGPAVGGLAAEWSLRAPFLIYGVLLIVPGVITAVMLGGRPRADLAAGPAPVAPALAGLGRALRSRGFRAAASATFADGFAATGVRSAIVPLFVLVVLHRSAAWTGIGFVVFAALNAAVLLPGGWAADALGRRPVIMAGAIAGAGGMLMLALLPSLPGYLAGLAVSGLGSGLLDVAPAAMIGDLLAGPGGTLVASYQMAGDAGTVAGPVAAGFLVDRVSYAAAFELAAALLGAAAVLAALVPDGGRRWTAAGPPARPPAPPPSSDPAPPGLTP
jgi:MFS family permease